MKVGNWVRIATPGSINPGTPGSASSVSSDSSTGVVIRNSPYLSKPRSVTTIAAGRGPSIIASRPGANPAGSGIPVTYTLVARALTDIVVTVPGGSTS